MTDQKVRPKSGDKIINDVGVKAIKMVKSAGLMSKHRAVTSPNGCVL